MKFGAEGLESWVEGLVIAVGGFGVWGMWCFGVQSAGFRVQGLEFAVEGVGLKVCGVLGFRVER